MDDPGATTKLLNRKGRLEIRRRTIAIAAALAVALGCGIAAAAIGNSPAPAVSAEKVAPSSPAPKVTPEKALEDEVHDLISKMQVNSSHVEVEVRSKTVIVNDVSVIDDKLVAESAFDRALALAESLGTAKADSVTWVINNSNNAMAAVTIKTDTSSIDKSKLTDLAKKLASAAGYALNDKAFEPVKAIVKAPSAGDVPKTKKGDLLVTPAKVETKKTTEKKEEAASKPAEEQPTDTSETSTDEEQESAPEPRWVEEQGHWKDVYETRHVDDRYVVDREAYDEATTKRTWVTSDGQSFDSAEAAEGYVAEHTSDEAEITYEVVESPGEPIHHEEEGHYEPVYDDVVSGQEWVVDVEGHWE